MIPAQWLDAERGQTPGDAREVIGWKDGKYFICKWLQGRLRVSDSSLPPVEIRYWTAPPVGPVEPDERDQWLEMAKEGH